MMTNTSSAQEPRKRLFSGDLSRMVGERRLLQMVLEGVPIVDASELTSQGGCRPEFRPQMMLTLLTYCYATSLFGSRDVESAIGNDPILRYICARTYPGWQDIRRFRRQNREAIQRCLTQVLQQTWAVSFDAGEADYAGYEWFETDLAVQVCSAARQRLDTAALMDGAESD